MLCQPAHRHNIQHRTAEIRGRPRQRPDILASLSDRMGSFTANDESARVGLQDKGQSYHLVLLHQEFLLFRKQLKLAQSRYGEDSNKKEANLGRQINLNRWEISTVTICDIKGSEHIYKYKEKICLFD